MIELSVPGYCDNCPDFEPNIEKKIIRCDDFYGNERITSCVTKITCEHADRCACIMKFLEENKEKENKEKEKKNDIC